jgi:hypothetical protein
MSCNPYEIGDHVIYQRTNKPFHGIVFCIEERKPYNVLHVNTKQCDEAKHEIHYVPADLVTAKNGVLLPGVCPSLKHPIYQSFLLLV